MPLPTPRRWKEGDPFSAGHLNESVDIVKASLPLSGEDANITPSRQGAAIHIPGQPIKPVPLPAKVGSQKHVGILGVKLLTPVVLNKVPVADLVEYDLGSLFPAEENGIAINPAVLGGASDPQVDSIITVFVMGAAPSGLMICLVVGGAGGGDLGGIYLGQVHIVVAANTIGVEYPFAVTTG